MAYSVSNYHVMTEAGIVAEDTDEQIYTKMAAWLNSLYSDIGTAEVFDVSDTLKAVRFMFNDVRSGICFGNLISSSSYAEKKYAGYIYSENATALSVYPVHYSYPITNIADLYLFAAKSDYGYIFVFCTPESANTSSCIHYLKCKDGNGFEKNATFAVVRYNTSADSFNYTVQVENEGVGRILKESVGSNLEKNIAVGSSTLLTKFIVPYTDFIPEGAYLLTGNEPTVRTVFELGGSKYVIGANYNSRHIIALKLE